MKFFVFPTDPEQQKHWTMAVSRDKWLPSKHNHLCSAHFVSGRPSNVPDRVDYVPSIFTDGKKRRPAASEESRRSGRASKRLKVCEDREEMKVAAEALLDLSTSSASMPPTNDASTQTGLAYTDIDCVVAECNKARANKVQLSKVVDDLESELRESKLNMRLIQGSDVITTLIINS